ncbi:hypothetical protein BS78_09G103000 [Paspalum vaginatum]|nr:hypothetical protein BS78_09G103000 [Paspalum vaginatum]
MASAVGPGPTTHLGPAAPTQFFPIEPPPVRSTQSTSPPLPAHNPILFDDSTAVPNPYPSSPAAGAVDGDPAAEASLNHPLRRPEPPHRLQIQGRRQKPSETSLSADLVAPSGGERGSTTKAPIVGIGGDGAVDGPPPSSDEEHQSGWQIVICRAREDPVATS